MAQQQQRNDGRRVVRPGPVRTAGPRWAVLLLAAMVPLWAEVVPAQDPARLAEIEQLTGQLGQVGGDGKEAREGAIERLLAMPWPVAHRALQQILGRDEDRDGLRPALLAALQRHLFGVPSAQFGGAGTDPRREILTGYLGSLARFWAGASDAALPRGVDGPAARVVLQRIPARDLEAAARTLLAAADGLGKQALLRCLADCQQVYLAQLLAEYLEDSEAQVRGVAAAALGLLTFRDQPFTSHAEFADWFAAHRDARYVDLAEAAARDAELRTKRARQEQAQSRIEVAREFVRAHTSRKPGVDWEAIQVRTLVDDPAVLDACLELLQQSLANGLLPDDSVQARQVFCRALLQRLRTAPPDQVHRRALLLEVAAYTSRPEEAELQNEVTPLLFAALDANASEEQVAALRGLRRFPTVDTRGRVVRHALGLLGDPSSGRARLEVALATLSSRTAPRWLAPAASDADKTDWLELIRRICLAAEWLELREAALQLALTLDARDQRVTEVFGMLLDFAKDRNLDGKFRSACLIHLQGWRDQQALADGWVSAMQQLLDDMEPEIRQLAAESLARLSEVVDPRRSTWITSSIMALRHHLRSESNPRVLRALVDSLQTCGREPQMPEKAIGALNYVLGELGSPVPLEHQFRLEPLLTALATIAGDPRADRGQWLGACNNLEQFGKRQSLRLVLQNQAAVDLAKDVGSTDPNLATPAYKAMYWLIRTALLKPPRESWTSSEELQREARDVRVAFGVLDGLDEAQRLDEPKHRLLRLEVELACGKFQEVVQRSVAWLANPTPNPVAGSPPREPWTADQRERLRCLAAEGQLGLGKPDLAAKTLGERDAEHPLDVRAIDLQGRIAKALLPTDAATAVALLEQVWKSTLPEDAQFRSRLLDWAQARVRTDAAAKAATLAEVDRYAALFGAQDCPPELRDAFQQLRSGK